MNNKERLYIPVNIVDSDDYFSGLALKEITILAISFAACVIVGFFYILATNDTIKVVFVSSVILVSIFGIIKRDRYNECLIDKIKIIWKYRKSQKRYEYQFFNVYETLKDDTVSFQKQKRKRSK